MSDHDGMVAEFRRGMETVQSGETFEGATRFTGGEGRGGQF